MQLHAHAAGGMGPGPVGGIGILARLSKAADIRPAGSIRRRTAAPDIVTPESV